MPDIALKVIVDDDHLQQTTAVSKLAEQAGLHVESVVPEIGVIYGSGDEALLETLAQVEGVQKVDREATYQLPPVSEKTPQ